METTLFVTKEYLEKQFKSFNNTLVKPNDRKIKEWLTTLNGNVEVEGSIANTIAKKVASVISGAPEDYDTLKEIADWISSHSSNAEEMLAKIEANKEGTLSENEKIELVEGIINTLNGSIDEEGSIAKMLKDAINTSVDNIIICESEDEDIDFSKADWLKNGNVEPEPEPVVFTASDIVGDKSTLTSYEIPEGVTEIGDGAFQNCPNLASVTLPSTLTKIESSAFRGCTSLTSIVISEGVTEIGTGAFDSCTNLASVTLPSTLKKIGLGAFYGCTSLTSIEIPEGVTEIGDGPFSGCSKLASVTLPSTLTKIGNSAFADCSLTEIYIPSSVTEVSNYAFDGCKNLTTIIYPDEEKWNELEENNEYLKNLRLAGKVVYSKECQSFTSNTELTHYEIPYGTTKIPDNAFKGCSNLESVTLPSTLKEIGISAFSNCKALTSINIPEGITKIDDNAFKGCSNLESVTLPSTLKEIGNKAFAVCASLTSIVIPEGVTKIEDQTFGGCTKLASVTIPNTVTEIGRMGAFDWSKVTFAEGSPFKKENGIIWNTETGVLVVCYDNSITSITIPEGVTEIGNAAFQNCPNLTSVTLPSTLKEIGDSAFAVCTSLTSIVIPEGVTEIESDAFSGCKKLASVVLPSTLTKIGNTAFSNCKALTSINFTGSEEQWNAITKAVDWNISTPSNMQIVYNYQG